jgi:hypothetical protein
VAIQAAALMFDKEIEICGAFYNAMRKPNAIQFQHVKKQAGLATGLIHKKGF